MNFTLIICTYQRPKALSVLLESVKKQTLYPNQILIIDGSVDNNTKDFLTAQEFENLIYIKVDDSQRGLTKQRNVGIQNVHVNSEIVCFLDDDTVLERSYFQELINSYKINPDAIGIGGYISNEVDWDKAGKSEIKNNNYFYIEEYRRKEALRYKLRTKLRLVDDTPPGFMPIFSHGRPVSYLPPSGKIYPVEFFMGGVSSFRKNIFNKIQFSTYFEGYGLYEDMDFCLRASKIGQLYVNTKARLGHFHDSLGRPNKFNYGKMVVRNGYYVWRVKFTKPTIRAKFKFYCNVFVLGFLRFINSFKGKNRKESLTESTGRFYGLISLIFTKPRPQ